MINCSPALKSVCHSSATTKLSSKARKSKQHMARSATAKLDQLTPVSSPEQNSANQQSSPLCAKMQFDDGDSRSADGESVMCNQMVKIEKQLSNQTDQQQTAANQSANQAAPPQSPLSASSSPSPPRQEQKFKRSCSPASRNNAASPSDKHHLANSINNSCSYNSTSSQLAAQLNSPTSPTASISSTCSSLTNANATPHGINDILKKSSADAAVANSSSASNSNSSASNLIDNHLSVFAAVASAAAINTNSNGLASTFTNSSPKLTGTGSQLAHATSALAAAVANRFYFNNSATPVSNGSAPPAASKPTQSNTNSNQNNSGTTAAVASHANGTSPPRTNAALNSSAALKLNLNDLSSRQFYWQQMVQNQALWQERFSAAVNNVTNGTNPNGAYSNLNSPLSNSSLLNHCNGQTAPAQTNTNLDSSFNCKFL